MTKLTLPTNKSVRKVYEIDLLEEQSLSTGVVASKKGVYLSPDFIPVNHGFLNLSENRPIRFYQVDKTLFAYTLTGRVHRITLSQAETISAHTYAKAPNIQKILHKGNQRFLIWGEDQNGYPTAEIVEEGSISLPQKIFPISAVVDNVFWSTDGKSLFFSPLDGINSFDKASIDNQLFIDDENGKILNLSSIESHLYIVCEHAILKVTLSAYPLDYKVERIDSEVLNVVANTVVSSGNNLFFISNGKFYFYNGKTFKIHDFLQEGESLNELDNAGESKGHYFVPAIRDEKKVTLAIEVSSGTRYTLKGYDALSNRGGLAFDSVAQTVVLFTLDYGKIAQSGYAYLLKTKSLDFGMQNKKRLLQISLSAKGRTAIEVEGDFGKRSFLAEGKMIGCNLVSRTFSLSLKGEVGCLPVEKIKITYSIQGE